MSKVTTGLWQNVHDGKYIKVRSVNHTITSMVDCSDEGCAKVYGLLIEDLLSDYKLMESDAKRDRLAQVKQSSGISKTLTRHGSLDEYVDSLPAYEQKNVDDKSQDMASIKVLVHKVIHEAFLLGYNNARRLGPYWVGGEYMPIQSKKELLAKLEGIHKPVPVIDDTVAQTFGDIQWDMGTQDKSEAILVTVCSKCGSTVPADSVEKPALRSWAARFLKAVKGIEVSK